MVFTVYILSNEARSIFYVGMTASIKECVFEHKDHRNKRTNCWQHCVRLVYREDFDEFDSATERQQFLSKEIHQWRLDCITQRNLNWADLSNDWFEGYVFRLYKQWHPPFYSSCQ